MTVPEVLAVIGVRSGSKGVVDKNIRPVAGHPLLAWILTAARRSASVSRLVVSTDSARYADIARHYGAEIPCMRPVSLAGDDVTDFPVVSHMVDWLAEHDDYMPDVVVRLLATVPLQQPGDIDAAVEVLTADPALTSVVVVAEARQHPAKAMRIVDTGGQRRLVSYLTGRDDDVEPQARQAYPSAYFRANLVASRAATLSGFGTLTGDAVGCHVVDQDRSIDVDTETDLMVADAVMRQRGCTIGEIAPYDLTRS